MLWKAQVMNCANGSPQCEYIKKEDAASPTISGDSVMITTAIGAHKGRKVATLDIHGAFLRTDLDEQVVVRIRLFVTMTHQSVKESERT